METFVPIADTDEWAAFWADNAAALIETVGDHDRCFALACNCSLLVGGGAAPLFRVGFVD